MFSKHDFIVRINLLSSCSSYVSCNAYFKPASRKPADDGSNGNWSPDSWNPVDPIPGGSVDVSSIFCKSFCYSFYCLSSCSSLYCIKPASREPAPDCYPNCGKDDLTNPKGAYTLEMKPQTELVAQLRGSMKSTD